MHSPVTSPGKVKLKRKDTKMTQQAVVLVAKSETCKQWKVDSFAVWFKKASEAEAFAKKQTENSDTFVQVWKASEAKHAWTGSTLYQKHLRSLIFDAFAAENDGDNAHNEVRYDEN